MKFTDFITEHGIVSAYNPRGQQQSNELNQEADQRLRQDMDSMGLVYKKIQGQYNGLPEVSYIVRTDKDTLQFLAKKYGQVSFSWQGDEIWV